MPQAMYEHEDPTLRIQVVKRVILCAWRGPPSVTQLDSLGRVGRLQFERTHVRSVTMNMMVAGNPRFSEEARQRSAEVGREAQAYSVGVAHVVLLPGLAGITTRTFLRTVQLLASDNSNRPNKTFSDARTAVDWALPLLGPDSGVMPAEVLAACDALARG